MREAGCSAASLGVPCIDGICPLGMCTTATPLLGWDDDAGMPASLSLAVAICEWSPPGGECPCGTIRSDLAVGSATSAYGPFTPSLCLQPCTFDPIGAGSCPADMTCDPFGTCRVACATDAECQLRARDVGSDGRIEWVVDPSTLASCDLVTGRCAHPGRAGARLGDACTDDHDCAANAFCAQGAMPGTGSCVQIGCSPCADTCLHVDRGSDLCITCTQAMAFGFSCGDAGVGDAAVDDAGEALDAGIDGG